ncbi:MAG TPA: hypothetical protein DEH22_11725 [Chloroflexi bacterium]|nr:hypothetical protein [Chloroflexota bacterium]
MVYILVIELIYHDKLTVGGVNGLWGVRQNQNVEYAIVEAQIGIGLFSIGRNIVQSNKIVLRQIPIANCSVDGDWIAIVRLICSICQGRACEAQKCDNGKYSGKQNSIWFINDIHDASPKERNKKKLPI